MSVEEEKQQAASGLASEAASPQPIGSMESNKAHESVLEDAVPGEEDPKGLIEPKLNPPPNHEDVSRRCIAYWLLSILSGIVVIAFLIFFIMLCKQNDVSFKEFRSLIELMLTPILTLVSAATGFYFGSQKLR